MKERRKFLRFPVSLLIRVEEADKSYQGKVEDFSREGVKCIFFEEFEYLPKAILNFEIQRPDKKIFVPFKGEIVWRRRVSSGWEIGVSIKEITSSLKSEILEFGYQNWLKTLGYNG